MKNAYVTVFFSIVLSLCISLLVALIYGARSNGIKMRGREVVQIGMESAFAEYEKTIFKNYKLIYVDPGYSVGSPSMAFAEEKLLSCMNKNFDELSFSLFGGIDLLKMSCKDSSTDKVRFASDDNGLSVQYQIVKYMKYKYKVGYLEDIFDTAFDYEDDFTKGEEVNSIMDDSISSIKEIETDSIVINEMIETSEEIVSGGDDFSSAGLLQKVGVDTSTFIGRSINNLLSDRGLNEGNLKSDYNMSFSDKMFFYQYLLEENSNYVNRIDDRILIGETEYLIAGNDSDVKNIEEVVRKLMLMREGLNLSALYADQEKMNLLKSISEAISLILMTPELSEPLTFVLATIWAYRESVADIKLLLSGKKVPLYKTKQDWNTEYSLTLAENISDEVGADKGLNYVEYLRILMCLTNKDTLTKRFMNLLECNVRKWNGNDAFRLDFCFDAWQVTSYLVSEYGYEFSATRLKDIEQ